MMKSAGFFVCPNISSVFRSSGSPTADPAVRDVANAIYHGGRVDGVQGMAAVAHIIQNRANRTASEPEHIVNYGSEQFTHMRQVHTAPHSHVERQLFEHATRMAVQLVKAPHRLASPDPTGGALYYDQKNPARLHSVEPAGASTVTTTPGDSSVSGDSSSGASSNNFGVPYGSGSSIPAGVRFRQAAPASARSASPDTDIEHDDSPPASPRPVPPTKSLRPLSFFRDHTPSGLGMMRRRNSDSSAGSQASASMAGVDVGSASSSTPTVVLPPASLGTPSLGAASMKPVGDAVETSLSPPPSPPLSPPHPISIPASSPGPQAGVTSRLRTSRLRPAGLTQPPLITARVGPADADGYHDMILSCGLYQDEVIDLMYRDLSPEDFESLCKLDERLPKRNIAQGSIVDRLPRVIAKDCNATECGVCLAEFEPSASVVKLPCRHFFHPNCISKWLTQCKSTCPLCTAPIEKETAADASNSDGSSTSTLRAV